MPRRPGRNFPSRTREVRRIDCSPRRRSVGWGGLRAGTWSERRRSWLGRCRSRLQRRLRGWRGGVCIFPCRRLGLEELVVYNGLGKILETRCLSTGILTQRPPLTLFFEERAPPHYPDHQYHKQNRTKQNIYHITNTTYRDISSPSLLPAPTHSVY
jgi:hypothetical protein